MILISAMSRNRVIGSGDGMPWNVPAEYQHFLDSIRDQTIVMGRRSFEIFGPDLTSAHNIVVTRSGVEFPGAVVVDNLDEALELARSKGTEVFIGGGGTIYAQTIDKASCMYLSIIPGEFTGDTCFPEIHQSDWEIVRREDRGTFEFIEYRRRSC